MRFLRNITFLWPRPVRFAAVCAILAAVACAGPTQPPPPPPPPPPPLEVACPTPLVREATSPEGTDVHFDEPAIIGGTPPFRIECTPGSGSIFGAGEHTVTCTVTDAAMAQGSCGFAVTVRVSRSLAKTRFVAFGDSITEGKISMAPVISLTESETYPFQLEQALRSRYPASDITVINEGAGGEDPRQGVLRLPGVLQAHRPEVVLLHEGTNALTSEGRVSLWATHLRTMVATARDNNVDVIIANILPVFPPHVTSRPRKPEFVIQLNRRIDSIAQEFDIGPVVDLYSEFLANRQLIGMDGLHPTREGQTRMAELFAAEIVRRYGVESQTLLRRPR